MQRVNRSQTLFVGVDVQKDTHTAVALSSFGEKVFEMKIGNEAKDPTSHASCAAKEFFDLCRTVFPNSIIFVLTDNGSEFKKHFDEELQRLHLVHYHTYPKTPKQNAHYARFNRTIQEEFVDFLKNLLLHPETFNRKLMDYLTFYNTERVHFAFGSKLSPVGLMLSLPRYQLIGGRECKSGRPYTVR